jgi:3-oxo-5-alpha-steroid 4-dehydrogenase 1
MTWYTGNAIYDTAITFALILIPLTIIGTKIFKTPYGRFGDNRLGLKMSPRLGWFLMELPASVTFIIVYIFGARPDHPVSLLFLGIWLLHYSYRGFIFPYLIRVNPGYEQTFNLSVVSSGWMVTILHGYLNAAFITTYGQHFTMSWLNDPRFILGFIVYFSGYILILKSDSVMRNLRPKDITTRAEGPRYKIPEKGLFKYVTNAHYLSELIAWAGFALATWSLAGVFIFHISAANLIPRAKENHKWYLDKFEDYPKDRKIIIPFIW